MRRRSLLAAVATATAAGIAGCTGARSSGVEVLDRNLTDVDDETATMRVRVENGGGRSHVEVSVDLAWTTDAADGDVFESYSDVVFLDGGERRWVDVAVRRYPDRENEYEHRVDAAATSRPLARFDYEPTDVDVGDLIAFDAGRSRVVEGTIAAFDWTIAGGYEVGRRAEYRLDETDADGVSVELRVTDTQGEFDTATRRIDPLD